MVTIANPITGLSVTSSVSVTVSVTLTAIVVMPGSATVADGATEPFIALAFDQFGNAYQPAFRWSLDAGSVGTVDANGLYTAPDAGTGAATVRAALGSVSGTAGITITDQVPASFLVTVTAADPYIAGTPFDVTVTVLDANGAIDAGYRGTIHFSSADPYGATLPADYTFTAGDAGMVTFPGQAALYTAGTWDITVTDPNSGITGSAVLTVTPGAAVAFQVIAPAMVSSGIPFDVTVLAVDAYGNVDPNYTGTITFGTSDPDPGVMLPPDYTFQPGDQGMATFAGGVTLITPGDQVLTVADTADGITGSVTITVTPGPQMGGRYGWRNPRIAIRGLGEDPIFRHHSRQADA